MEAGVDVAEDIWGVVGGSSWGVIYVEVESVKVQANIGRCERVGLKGEGSRGKGEESVGAGRGGVWGPAGKSGRRGGGGWSWGAAMGLVERRAMRVGLELAAIIVRACSSVVKVMGSEGSVRFPQVYESARKVLGGSIVAPRCWSGGWVDSHGWYGRVRVGLVKIIWWRFKWDEMAA